MLPQPDIKETIKQTNAHKGKRIGEIAGAGIGAVTNKGLIDYAVKHSKTIAKIPKIPLQVLGLGAGAVSGAAKGALLGSYIDHKLKKRREKKMKIIASLFEVEAGSGGVAKLARKAMAVGKAADKHTGMDTTGITKGLLRQAQNPKYGSRGTSNALKKNLRGGIQHDTHVVKTVEDAKTKSTPLGKVKPVNRPSFKPTKAVVK